VTDSTAPVREMLTVGTAQVADTFTVTLKNGSVIIGRKAPGVLKLRLRRLLGDMHNDPDMVVIGSAILGITTFDGAPPVLRTSTEFEGFLDRFGSDDELNRFVNAYQRFVDPEAMDTIELALEQGVSQGLIGDALQAFIARRAMEYQRERLEQVRD
jgi:hypothetical protein